MDLNKVVHKQPTLATPETTVLDAIKMMASAKVGAIVVVNDAKKVQGIFTERDNLLRVTLSEKNPRTTWLAEVMTAPVVTCKGDLQHEEALSIMVRNRYSCLPLVDEANTIVGVVTIRDLLMRRISEKETAIQTLEAFASAGGPG